MKGWKKINSGYLMTLDEVAHNMSLSYACVQKAEQTALAKLRQISAKTGVDADELLSYLKYSGL